MERRTLLVGSGVALTTALAGCMGSDESDDDDDSGSSSDDTDDQVGSDDIPGMDTDELEDGYDDDMHDGTIDSISRDGETVSIEMTATEYTDEATQEEYTDKQVEQLADAMEAAITDPTEFYAAIESIEVTVSDTDETQLLSFSLEVAWLIAYLEGDHSSEELADRTYETAEMA